MKGLKTLFETAKENVGFLVLSVAIVVTILVVAYGAEYLIAKGRGEKRTKEKLRIHRMTLIAMLTAIAEVLMLFEIPLWFLPAFYEIDLSELPVIIGAFTLGPVAGVTIEFLKIVLNLLINGTATAFVGEFANFLIGCAFVVPASIFYYAKKTKKNAIIGLVTGTVTCALVGCFLNAFVLLPAYSRAFHMEMDVLIAMGTEKNSLISGMFSFVVFAVAPFNILKCGIVSVITLFIYKKISRLLKAGQL
ncbi:MAG: ECF transporter S component [Lachnospiraceae bacterium]|nr:ECF transporter S component [Lachnospiraceae bacterium]